MKKFQIILLLLMVGCPFLSYGQTPFFKQENDTLYFIVYFEEWVYIHEAFSDFFIHSEFGSRYFEASEFVVIKDQDNEYKDVNPEAPYGLVVYFNGEEWMRADTMISHTVIAEVVGAKYSRHVLPDWLKGNWKGEVFAWNHGNSIEVEYSFNPEDEKFNVSYDSNMVNAQVIINTVTPDFIRCSELYFFDDMIRQFGSGWFEIKRLKDTETLYIKYPPGRGHEKLGIGFLQPDKQAD